MLPRTRKSPRTHRACRRDARSRRSCHSRPRAPDRRQGIWRRDVGLGLTGRRPRMGAAEYSGSGFKAVKQRRARSDQLGRGGQDDRDHKRDGGEAEGRSTRRGRCGRFRILKTAHRDASGLFQSVQVGSRQGPFLSFCAKLNRWIDTSDRIGLYGEQSVKVGDAQKPSRGGRRSFNPSRNCREERQGGIRVGSR